MREGLTALLAGAGAELHRHKYGVAGDHLLFRHDSEFLGAKQTFKIEISSLERFAVLGVVERPLTVPTTDPGSYEPAQVRTAELIELIATKIRAFHQRRKGRDLYDLWLARSRVSDAAVLRKLVLFYFACRDVPFDRRAFFVTLDDKLSDRRFSADVDAFLPSTSPFGWLAAAGEVRAWLEEVLAPDEEDERFVLGVRYLNGSATGPNAAAAAAALDHPLVFLLGDRVTLSQPASDFTAEDLRRLMARARPVRDRNEGI